MIIPKIVNKSIEISKQLFPLSYSLRSKYRVFHFAFLYKRNTLLSIGQNSYENDGVALRFAKKFNIDHTIKYPSLHAEIDAISRVFGREYIDNTMKLVVIRLNKFGELRNSKPCHSCTQILHSLNIERVWYSINGDIQYGI